MDRVYLQFRQYAGHATAVSFFVFVEVLNLEIRPFMFAG